MIGFGEEAKITGIRDGYIIEGGDCFHFRELEAGIAQWASREDRGSVGTSPSQEEQSSDVKAR